MSTFVVSEHSEKDWKSHMAPVDAEMVSHGTMGALQPEKGEDHQVPEDGGGEPMAIKSRDAKSYWTIVAEALYLREPKSNAMRAYIANNGKNACMGIPAVRFCCSLTGDCTAGAHRVSIAKTMSHEAPRLLLLCAIALQSALVGACPFARSGAWLF